LSEEYWFDSLVGRKQAFIDWFWIVVFLAFSFVQC